MLIREREVDGREVRRDPERRRSRRSWSAGCRWRCRLRSRAASVTITTITVAQATATVRASLTRGATFAKITLRAIVMALYFVKSRNQTRVQEFENEPVGRGIHPPGQERRSARSTLAQSMSWSATASRSSTSARPTSSRPAIFPAPGTCPRGYLESRIEGVVPDRSQRVILYCASGNRSALAARTLSEDLGYENVESMTGGITLWKDRGYEVEVPKTLSAEQRDRYSRHLLSPRSARAASASCSTRACCCSARAGSARRPRCTWRPPASARSGSSTTTSSTSRTSSAR